MIMMGEALPEPWTEEWLKPRPVRVKFRRGEGFDVRPEYESCDGRVVRVYMPRLMEEADEGGHSLYAGDVVWDLVDRDEDTPVYLCEQDFVWL